MFLRWFHILKYHRFRHAATYGSVTHTQESNRFFQADSKAIAPSREHSEKRGLAGPFPQKQQEQDNAFESNYWPGHAPKKTSSMHLEAVWQSHPLPEPKQDLPVSGQEEQNSTFDPKLFCFSAGPFPDLPQQGGRYVRVFRNKVIDNDTDNFAPEGNIVGEVPRGTGIIIQANSDVEVFDNDISGNGTVNVSIVTYSNETQDENYYPHPRSIQIHGNRFGEGGFDPDIETGELAAILFELSGGNMPDIFWDGVLPTSQIIFGQPDEERLILSNNGDATFLTINPIKYLLPFFDPVETDISEYEGEVRPLAEITINSF